jgi:hypothetical protein
MWFKKKQKENDVLKVLDNMRDHALDMIQLSYEAKKIDILVKQAEIEQRTLFESNKFKELIMSK